MAKIYIIGVLMTLLGKSQQVPSSASLPFNSSFLCTVLSWGAMGRDNLLLLRWVHILAVVFRNQGDYTISQFHKGLSLGMLLHCVHDACYCTQLQTCPPTECLSWE